jgi:23S rRNA maturation-related 3'-5' exoribonuclease YhaM
LRKRSDPYGDLDPEEFKHQSLKDIEGNTKVKNFRGQINRDHAELLSRGSKRSRKLSENLIQSERAKSEVNS